MCNAASFVLTKSSVFWSMRTDHHEDIIREFELSQDGVRGPNILRVEITPPNMTDYGTSPEQWTYKLDQDLLPEWHDAKADEARTRVALAEWIEKRVIRENEKRNCKNGIFFALGNSLVTARGNSQITARDNSQITARDNSQIIAWDNSQIIAWDNSLVTARDNSLVTARDNSLVKQFAGTVQPPVDYAVVIDRREDKPVCITAVVDVERTK